MGWKWGYRLTEKEIRWAIEHTRSNTEAAAFLRMNYDTWKKYASHYIDSETGISLFDLHKQTRKNRPKSKKHHSVDNRRILAGEIKIINFKQFKEFLFREAFLAEKCHICGFDERRVTDFKTPLILAFKDGDKYNGTLENLELLCYNCYFLNVGKLPPDVAYERPKFEIDERF